jgi:hypothetical protein
MDPIKMLKILLVFSKVYRSYCYNLGPSVLNSNYMSLENGIIRTRPNFSCSPTLRGRLDLITCDGWGTSWIHSNQTENVWFLPRNGKGWKITRATDMARTEVRTRLQTNRT